MAAYIELAIAVADQEQKDILVALLTEAGASGFEETHAVLKVIIPQENYEASVYKEIIEQNDLKYSISIIEERNWNAEWEAGFHPVVIDDFCIIRAAFHEAKPGMQHDIVITPKMSFGTGHHATTHMMVKAMQGISFNGCQVFDFGTGTGVLAILAEKLGASSITAIDNDSWSIENAEENFNSNNCCKILLFNSEEFSKNIVYDVILANINRNIILQNMGVIKQHLAKDGVVLLSGLLTGDEPVIMDQARKQDLTCCRRFEMDGWICLQLKSNKEF